MNPIGVGKRAKNPHKKTIFGCSLLEDDMPKDQVKEFIPEFLERD